MSTESVQQVIRRALTEEAYRELLLTNPDQALAGLDLTAEETGALKSLKREEFDSGAGELQRRISKMGMALPNISWDN